VEASPRNIELGLSAINRLAAFASEMAKQPKWASEQEVRHVTLIPQGANIQLQERQSGGRTIRYLPVQVRENGKRIAFAEIILGSNQNLVDARES
jgi:hypothetical protein